MLFFISSMMRIYIVYAYSKNVRPSFVDQHIVMPYCYILYLPVVVLFLNASPTYSVQQKKYTSCRKLKANENSWKYSLQPRTRKHHRLSEFC